MDANRAGDETSELRVGRWVTQAASRNLENVGALSAFTRQMERYPQLPADEQVRLAAIVREAIDARERLATERYRSAKRRAADEALATQGDRAAQLLVGSNFRLVILICRELAEERHGRERAVDLMADLVGEANVALVEAINSFEPERCPVFATYAARVVRDRVRAMLGRDGPIRIPPSWHRLKRIAAIRIPQLQTELGRPPTRQEIHDDLLARCMTWAESKLTPEQRELPTAERDEIMRAKLRKQGMFGALESLDDVLQTSQSAASLDATLSDDNGSTLGDMVTSAVDGELFDSVDLAELREQLAVALQGLDERERQVLLLRYGFNGDEPWTYAQIGEQFGVTAERIRQIERAVLTKLRSSNDVLRSFLPGIAD